MSNNLILRSVKGLISGGYLTVLAALLHAFAYSGCAKKASSVTFAGWTTTATTTTTTTPTSCSTTLLDGGQKGTVTAVQRGIYSDAKVIPGTPYPAVAYADPGSLVLKFTFWNGTNYATEPVSGDNGAAFVRLAFLSNGTPIVLWTLGVNLKAAVRSAPVSTASATWAAGVIDTGTAPRAVEIAVNPLDQVGVSFLTDSATGGRAKFLYCDATCAGPANFVTMSPNPYIEATNIIANQTATGMAWCKASSTAYYPALTYGVTGNVRFAICQNTLANCASDGSWNVSANVVTSGLVASKLQIDPTVAGDVPKAIALAASGIRTYKMGATACTGTPVNMTLGTATLGGGTTGSQWMTLLQDPASKFHVIANTSTTSVSYYNSTTTDINGAWNAAGTVETTALAAASGGGAALDTANTGIYSAYGQNVAPFDVRLTKIVDYTVASNTAAFSRSSPDQSGSVQLAAAASQLKNISSAATSAGRPAAAYVDMSIGAAASSKLKYAYRTGPTATSTWVTTILPGTFTPEFPSLAFDHNNRPWISYFEANGNKFVLTTNSLTDGTGFWTSYDFPALPAGGPVALPAANNTALAMHYSAGVANPVMIVIDTNAGSRGLKAAKFTQATQTWSTVTTIDALAVSGAAHVSADFDASGNIAVAYEDINATRARYASSTDGTAWSSPLSVSGVSQGAGVTVRINPSGGSPAMAYYDRGNNTVYYSSCSGTVASCATSGWSTSTVDSGAGVSGLASGNHQLLSAALVFSATGTPTVIYPRGQGAGGKLMSATNSSGSFVSTVLVSGANGGLSGSNALNFAVSGWNVSAVRNAAGLATAVFLGAGNWINVNSCGD